MVANEAREFLGRCFDDGLLGAFSGEAPGVALGYGFGAIALVRPPTWWTLVYGFAVSSVRFLHCSCRTVVPNSFVTGDWFPGREFFHGPGRWKGDILGMIQVHYIYYEIYVVIITTGIRSQGQGPLYRISE